MHSHSGRGGPRSADHVDILGHMDVLADVLTIAAGHGDILEDKITSDVRRIAGNINIDEDDCCDEGHGHLGGLLW